MGEKPTEEMRRGSADSIRASGHQVPHQQAGYKTAICLPITPKSVLATREASIQIAMDPRTDIVEVAALLVTARTVVADPARWCTYRHALDANGHSCEGRSNNAVCWGAAGALDRAAVDAEAAGHDIAEARRQLDQFHGRGSSHRSGRSVQPARHAEDRNRCRYHKALEGWPIPRVLARPSLRSPL